MGKVGRPPAEDPKSYRVTVRMPKSEYERLSAYAKENDQTITETMLKGVDLLMKKKAKKA